jgi:hypothetical protein
MITDKDIQKLKAVFATKDDLINMEHRFDSKFATKDDLINMEHRFDSKFATKNDLKNFATKDDLKNFATKDDLKNFATKDDLKSFQQTLLLQLQENSNKLENKMNTLEINILSELEKHRMNVLVTTEGYGDRLEEHHQRLKKIEDKCRILPD